MPTKYFVMFCILLAVPLVCLVGVVAYCCFKIGVTEGIIALAISVCLVASVTVALVIRAKKRK